MNDSQFSILRRDIDDMKNTLAEHTKDTRDRLMRLETQFIEIPAKVGSLEKFRWTLLGAASIVAGACSYIFRHI